MKYVLRQIHPPGKSALAHEATAVTLATAALTGGIVSDKYLEWSDPNADNGVGDERWTDDVSRARKFASFGEAMACWQAESTVRPLRDDGKPNRPLTVYSVTVEKVE